MLNTKSKILGVSVLSAMLFLAGCGGDDKAASGGKAPTENIVRIGNGSEPESLDPHKTSDSSSFNVIRQMFLGLTTSDKDGKTIPSLATEWSNVDEKVWTFKLNPAAKWSNGDAITAHDFVYSLRRLLDPNTASPYSSYLVDARFAGAKEIVAGTAKTDTLGVKAIDDHTLEITLTDPVPYLADLMALPVTFPVHQKTIETHGDKWLDPANIVVSGAYKLTKHAINDMIVLNRNEAYFDNANTSIDTVEFLPISGTAQLNRYQAGEIDLNTGAPPELYKKLKEELGNEVKASPNFCNFYYGFNTQKAPTDNVKVRQALSMTIDRDIITKDILAQGQIPAYQFTPTAMQGIDKVMPVWATQDKAARAATAKQLLNEAGFNESNPLKVEILYTTSEVGKKLTSATAAMWKEQLGFVDTSIINQEWKNMLTIRRQGDYQISFGGWCADYNEPSSFLNVFRSNNENNDGKYNNPQFDKLLDQTTAAGVAAEQRKDLYLQAERLLQEDVPAAYLYVPAGIYLIKPYLQAESYDDPLHNWQVKDWKLKK